LRHLILTSGALSHSHIINFGHAMFDDLYGAFKGGAARSRCEG
jgi:hypothetical protein